MQVTTKSIVSKRRDCFNFDRAKAKPAEKAVSFLQRNDNIRMMSGKKDFKKVAKGFSKQSKFY